MTATNTRRTVAAVTAALLTMSLVVIGRPAAAKGGDPRAARPTLAPVPPDALTEALEQGRVSRAEYTLHRARSIFTLGEVREEFGSVARVDPHSATLILRDLALRTEALPEDEQVEAERILARPDQTGDPDNGWSTSATKATPKCGVHICVHYVTDTDDKASDTWAATALATFEEVWTKEVDVMGFRAPKSDGAKGGDSRLDVYLDNIDVDGLYGYCATGPFTAPPWDQPVYCSVDNDYATFVEKGVGNDPLALLQATAAHEFFHAIQFAYDAGEDAWIQEATATWIEDEVYDDVNDNRAFRANSMSAPSVPADSWEGMNGAPQGFQYGQWVWMRYLSLKHGNAVMNALWDRLDATTGSPDDYSVEGLANVLSAKGGFAASFADFTAVNARPSTFYDEADEDPLYYRPSPRAAIHSLTSSTPTAVEKTSDVDHLSSRYIGFRPGDGVTSTDEITVSVNMSDAQSGSRATLVSIAASSGATTYRPIPLDSEGDGQATVSFGAMLEVTLVLTNASDHYSGCAKFPLSVWTCNGTADGDNKTYGYSAAVGSSGVDPGDVTNPVVSAVKVRPAPVPRGKTARFGFHLDERARVRVVILRSGRKIATSNAAEFAAGSRCCVKWPVPRRAATGRYTAKVVATDPSGNKGVTKKVFKVVK